MPKPTFFNLNTTKKEKIEKAIEDEFSRESFEKASISNIIIKAEIPRGSFYQYFEDKDDAINYVIQNYMKKEKEAIKNIMEQNNGNIFKASIQIFDYIIEKIQAKDNLKLYKNILEELKKQNISMFQDEKECTNKLDNSIDLNLLDIKDKDDLIYIMRIISIITRSICVEVISQKISKEEGKERLYREFEILKRGMLNKNIENK